MANKRWRWHCQHFLLQRLGRYEACLAPFKDQFSQFKRESKCHPFPFKMQALNKYLNGKNHNGLFESSMRVWITVKHPLIERIVSLDVGQTKPVDFFFSARDPCGIRNEEYARVKQHFIWKKFDIQSFRNPFAKEFGSWMEDNELWCHIFVWIFDFNLRMQ